MFIVYNTETGYSDESMRFADLTSALAYTTAHTDEDRGDYFDIRREAAEFNWATGTFG